MSSLLADLSVKCELQAMDKLALRKQVRELEDENAELRELVNDMWICISHGSDGWDCTGCKRDPDSVCIGGISEFSQRMRELGIEVD